MEATEAEWGFVKIEQNGHQDAALTTVVGFFPNPLAAN